MGEAGLRGGGKRREEEGEEEVEEENKNKNKNKNHLSIRNVRKCTKEEEIEKQYTELLDDQR